MELQAHPDTGGHHLPQQLHVGEDPLVPYTRYAEVTLEMISNHVSFVLLILIYQVINQEDQK